MVQTLGVRGAVPTPAYTEREGCCLTSVDEVVYGHEVRCTMRSKNQTVDVQPNAQGYRAPKLYVYGAMRELTAGGSQGVLEGTGDVKSGMANPDEQRP